METKGLGAGSYPDAPEQDMRKVRLICTFITYMEVPREYENYSEMREYIENIDDDSHLMENAEKIMIEDIEK